MAQKAYCGYCGYCGYIGYYGDGNVINAILNVAKILYPKVLSIIKYEIILIAAYG